MYLCTREQMREMDRRTIEEVGIAGIILMEVAGREAAHMIDGVVKEQKSTAKTVAIFCGGGNNGGDGYVIARYLDSMGYDVDVMLLAHPESITGDAWTNLEIVRRLRPSLLVLREQFEEINPDALHEALPNYDIYVDALLGTGLEANVRGIYRDVIRYMNERPGLKVAVDVPSGLDANTGWPLGTAFVADYTCTFGMGKFGLYLDPGRAHAGQVRVADIGILPETVDMVGIQGELLVSSALRDELYLPRPLRVHKGDLGHVALIAGSTNMPGAAILAVGGAITSGVGLTTLVSRPSVTSLLTVHYPEAMVRGILPEEGGLSDEVASQLPEFLRNLSALGIGPGMGREPVVRHLIELALSEVHTPVVIDADGLNCISDDLSCVADALAPVVLTPHPGEMARLTGVDIPRGMRDPIAWAAGLSEQLGAFVILKFSTTVITAPDGRVAVNTSGNPGMATGGSGDVLTGLVSGLLATGLTPWDACRLAVFAHGRAGDVATERVGERALRAGHLVEALPDALSFLE